MLEHMRSGTTMPDEKGLVSEVEPDDGFLLRQQMVRWQCHHHRLTPQKAGMAIGRVYGSDDEGHIKPPFANQGNRLGRAALQHGLLDHRIAGPIPAAQIGEEAGRNGAMQADRTMPLRPFDNRARRAHGMIELCNAVRHLSNIMASSLG